MKQTICYGDGNVLSYSEFGHGYPVLVQHGLIASINDSDLFCRLLEAGIRLICVARPGYGASSPYLMKNMAEWGEIVSVLVDALSLTRFDVLGMSSGAPYSYAIGNALPEKVRNIYIFSGTPALYDDQILSFWPYPVNRKATILELEQVAKDLFFSNLSHEALQQDDIQDSMANDCFGIAQDFRLRCNAWGFRLADMRVPVYMQHSKEDEQVPIITADLTAKLLPNCRLEIRESGEHFSTSALDSFLKNVVTGYLL